jgi:uncharacterized protein YecE (DUF72 family)
MAPHIYRSAYGDAAHADWARRIAAWINDGRNVHVYFNNTMKGAAPADAARLIDLLARTRASQPSPVHEYGEAR